MGFRNRNLSGITEAEKHLREARTELLRMEETGSLDPTIAKLLRAKYEVEVCIASLIEESS